MVWRCASGVAILRVEFRVSLPEVDPSIIIPYAVDVVQHSGPLPGHKEPGEAMIKYVFIQYGHPYITSDLRLEGVWVSGASASGLAIA